MQYPIFKNDLNIKNLNKPWEEVLHLGVKKNLLPGTKVGPATEGYFYYIAKGRVRMCYANSMGHELLMNYVEEGCLLADIGSFLKSQTTVFECLNHVTLYQFSQSMLNDMEFIRKYPHLYHNLLDAWAKKSRHIFERACSIVLYSPKNQLCSFICRLVAEEGDKAVPNITHEELSLFLGIHRSTLTRTIKEMRDEGLIGAFSKNRIEVLNMEAIKSYSNL